MNKTMDRVFWILRAGANTSRSWQGKSRIEEMTVHRDYSEPGYHAKNGCIVTGNFNEIDEYDRETRTRVKIEDTPGRVAKLLERAGAEIEWSDEWTECSDCYKLVRTSPDSYGWKRSYFECEYGIQCVECVKENPEGYLQELEGSNRRCMTIDIPLEDHGYVLAQEGFENGLYGGQSADPKEVAKALKKLGVDRFIFVLDDVGQFDITFSVWVHEDQINLVKQPLPDTSEIDPAEMMKKALREMSVPSGDGIKYTKIDLSNGTSESKLITQDDFIDGNL